jgi:hypothetical protein
MHFLLLAAALVAVVACACLYRSRRVYRVVGLLVLLVGLAGTAVTSGTPWGREVLRQLWADWFPPPMPYVLPAEPLPAVVGVPAPDVTLCDSAGGVVRLADYRGKCPVVLEFGSVTCKFAARHMGEMDELADRFHGRAEVFFVYGPEAHPGVPDWTGVVDDATLLREGSTIEDYRAIAQKLHSSNVVRRRILLDQAGPESAAAQLHLFKDHFNAVVVVGGDGNVIFHQDWLQVDELDEFLTAHLTAALR